VQDKRQEVLVFGGKARGTKKVLAGKLIGTVLAGKLLPNVLVAGKAKLKFWRESLPSYHSNCQSRTTAINPPPARRCRDDGVRDTTFHDKVAKR